MENNYELLWGFPGIFVLEGETQRKKTKQLEHSLKEKAALKMQSQSRLSLFSCYF